MIVREEKVQERRQEGGLKIDLVLDRLRRRLETCQQQGFTGSVGLTCHLHRGDLSRKIGETMESTVLT